MNQLPNLPSIPSTHGELISYSIREEGEFPRKTFVIVCEYPNCQREFDGKNWSVTKDYRKQPTYRNLFTGEMQ